MFLFQVPLLLEVPFNHRYHYIANNCFFNILIRHFKVIFVLDRRNSLKPCSDTA